MDSLSQITPPLLKGKRDFIYYNCYSSKKANFIYAIRKNFYLNRVRFQSDQTFVTGFRDNTVDFLAKIESAQWGSFALIVTYLKLILSKYYL